MKVRHFRGYLKLMLLFRRYPIRYPNVEPNCSRGQIWPRFHRTKKNLQGNHSSQDLSGDKINKRLKRKMQHIHRTLYVQIDRIALQVMSKLRQIVKMMLRASLRLISH